MGRPKKKLELAPLDVPAATRRRYTDRRTEEGKKLQAVQDSLINSVGGPEAMNAPQALLLASVSSTLIILWEISAYLDKGSVVDVNGELSPCLTNGFRQYSDNLRRDLLAFYGLGRFQIRRERIPRIEDLIHAGEGGDK
jgi:hypothetical protein